MGGRSPYYLKEVVGSGKKVGLKKANLTKSFTSGDVEGVARNTANLVLEHRDIAKILIYSKKLFASLKGKYSPDELKIVKEISKKVRIDWANLKSDQRLESNRIIDSAVVDNVSRVMKERA